MPASSDGGNGDATCPKYFTSLLIIALTCTPIMTIQVTNQKREDQASNASKAIVVEIAWPGSIPRAL